MMWRGFAVKKGTDPKAVSYLVDLLHKVSKDERWGKFVRTMRLQSVFLEDEEFTQVVNRDAESSKTYLRKAGFKIGSVLGSAGNSTSCNVCPFVLAEKGSGEE